MSRTPEVIERAHRIDRWLRSDARTIAKSMTQFRELIVMAREKRVHEVVGFKSWTAYIADVIGKEMGQLLPDDRRQIVALLAGEEMSQRAIAEAVGVSQKTVDRDLDQLSHDDSVVLPDNTIGLDNKKRPAHPPKPDVPQPAPPTPARKRLKVPFGNDWMAGRFISDNPSEEIEQYVQNVASIGRVTRNTAFPEIQDYDLDTPLGNTLPWLTGDLDPDDPDDTYTARRPDEREQAAKLAKALRAARPRIDELIALLERRAT